MKGSRRKARAIALQVLYEIDSAKRKPEGVVERLLEEADLPEENDAFVRGLVSGVVQNEDEIDRNIQRFAPAWPLEQMAIIDRNILRLAIFEILFDNEVPIKVAVNEAVELAKIYGSENSARFINGVLGSVSTLSSR
ncbi:MAG: transcription antitermination factor NusB [Chloroflexi bacterium RBG_16_50_9]|nr:MAG: transcription antitermination factor NusB [Chloroflexi bacterium RBG_16_50_9]